MTGFPTGRFAWYECYSGDPQASEKFYSDLIGWGAKPWGPEGWYRVITNGDRDIGGYMQLTDEMKAMDAPPHWLAYVVVPDADETAKQVEALGGRVLKQPFDVPEVGRMVALADPHGAVICGYQPAGDAPGTDAPAEIGDFSWHELLTTDYQGAWEFYSQLFGWQKADEMDMGEAGIYLMYSNGAHPLGGMYNKDPHVPAPAWLYYIKVPNVDELQEKVTAAGGQVTVGPIEVPGGDRIVQCVDPQGVAFALHSS